ncbi:MAG: hypothetical protein KF735_20400 [Chelatococcus sp.]|uniref:hypothetical protein n=1 Tax=Chelatococcus sp. TaxID=1953771 RepID=UPI0025BA820F|nr:hypothetical protein [Chelatococcus sp.]MBX3540014.1 hypothetical protein [Chelatococcus sp.]
MAFDIAGVIREGGAIRRGPAIMAIGWEMSMSPAVRCQSSRLSSAFFPEKSDVILSAFRVGKR